MHTKFRGKGLRIWKAAPVIYSETFNPAPAQLHLHNNSVFVRCGGQTSLELIEVQLEGKKRSSAQDFLHGYRPLDGETLGE
jgi:methionyl-tRNA formyltransferase